MLALMGWNPSLGKYPDWRHEAEGMIHVEQVNARILG